ncbi:MAG: hypothetical protein QXH07_01850 [Thermoplasmata archaeon]
MKNDVEELRELSTNEIEIKHYFRTYLFNLAGAAQIALGLGAIGLVGHIVFPAIGTGLLTLISGQIYRITDYIYDRKKYWLRGEEK